MIFTIEVFKKDNEFVAKCNELNIYTYGKNDKNAIERLRKVINFYIESAAEYLSLEDDNNKIIIKKEKSTINNIM